MVHESCIIKRNSYLAALNIPIGINTHKAGEFFPKSLYSVRRHDEIDTRRENVYNLIFFDVLPGKQANAVYFARRNVFFTIIIVRYSRTWQQGALYWANLADAMFWPQWMRRPPVPQNCPGCLRALGDGWSLERRADRQDGAKRALVRTLEAVITLRSVAV
jgi:hypothetical protein